MSASNELDELLVYWVEDQVLVDRDFGCSHRTDDDSWDEHEGQEGACRAYWLGVALHKRERIYADIQSRLEPHLHPGPAPTDEDHDRLFQPAFD